MAAETETPATAGGSSWLNGLGDLVDILGNAAVSGASAYATVKTADAAADGQKTPGANAAGATATQPAGVATTGTGDGAKRARVLAIAGVAVAVVLGVLVFLFTGRRRR